MATEVIMIPLLPTLYRVPSAIQWCLHGVTEEDQTNLREDNDLKIMIHGLSQIEVKIEMIVDVMPLGP